MLRDEEGAVLRLWNGLRRPVSMALDRNGQLFVSDSYLDEVAIYPPIR